tara:strand:+ start:155 stop:1054 length:900 start_codon:yes stop_codon:yes gene_type:complete
MSWIEKKGGDSSIELPTGYPSFDRISSFVKHLINASQFYYHESEAFEVTEVILNEPENRGCVRGTFINNPNQPIKGGVVKPLMPNILQVPLVGESVVVIEYNGQHYYTSIINRKGSVNENSIPGAAGNYKKNTKFGEKFERKDVKPLEISEGCILFEGRFGQSIHFGNNKQKPIIKIVAGHRGTTENINNDDSSIYLSGALNNSDIEDKKIQIKSNSIFINGSDIRLGTTVETDLQPVAKGDTVKEILDDIVDVLSQVLPIAIDNTQTPISTKNPTLLTKINSLKTKTENILSTKVKTQ